MKDKTETKCWILLKDDIEGIIETLIPIKKIKGNDLERNTCQRSYKKYCLHTSNVENIHKHWK